MFVASCASGDYDLRGCVAEWASVCADFSIARRFCRGIIFFLLVKTHLHNACGKTRERAHGAFVKFNYRSSARLHMYRCNAILSNETFSLVTYFFFFFNPLLMFNDNKRNFVHQLHLTKKNFILIFHSIQVLIFGSKSIQLM